MKPLLILTDLLVLVETMQTILKKILFINRTSLAESIRAQEALDALLMASAFNQEVNLLFMDDGILQLKSEPRDELCSQKNFTKTFRALSLYDIKNVYVDATSLKNYDLTENDLIIPTTLLDSVQIGKLIQQQDTVLTF